MHLLALTRSISKRHATARNTSSAPTDRQLIILSTSKSYDRPVQFMKYSSYNYKFELQIQARNPRLRTDGNSSSTTGTSSSTSHAKAFCLSPQESLNKRPLTKPLASIIVTSGSDQETLRFHILIQFHHIHKGFPTTQQWLPSEKP